MRFSREGYPFADTRPYVRALIEAFTPERCMWGSDWPFLRATERIDYGPLLKLVEALLPDAGERRERPVGYAAAPLRVRRLSG